MNRRIRKKREKQQLARAIRELVALAEKRQQKRQEAIDRFLTAYSAYLAKQGGAERRTPWTGPSGCAAHPGWRPDCGGAKAPGPGSRAVCAWR